MTDIIIIIGLIVIITLLCIILLRPRDAAFTRIEKGVDETSRALLENKAREDAFEKSFALILKETMRTREYLGVTDAKLSKMLSSINDINHVMVNTKQRGSFGEYTLYHLLSLYFGNDKDVYEVQYHFQNGRIADAVLKIPDTKRVLAVDSKFPLENYQRICADPDDKKAGNEFVRDVKKHINDIKTKYINEETVTEAIMFIPSEAVYLYICQEAAELFDYAYRARVLITSPSTLMGVCLTIIQMTRDYQRSKHLEQIEKEIIRLKEDSDRLRERYEKERRGIEALLKQNKELGISVDKINQAIDKANRGEDL